MKSNTFPESKARLGGARTRVTLADLRAGWVETTVGSLQNSAPYFGYGSCQRPKYSGFKYFWPPKEEDRQKLDRERTRRRGHPPKRRLSSFSSSITQLRLSNNPAEDFGSPDTTPWG